MNDDADATETDEQIILRELGESDVDAGRALAVLVGTLVARHVDCELHKLGRPPTQLGGRRPWGPGQERANALTAALDALHQLAHRGSRSFDTAPRPDLPADDPVNVARLLMRTFFQCQLRAEREAGLGGDDDDGPPPMMRLVRE